MKLPKAPALFATALMSLLCAAPAHAQTHYVTYLASNGANGGDCSNPATPCRYFQTAYPQTTAGGRMVCLDAVDLGSIVIEQSLTMDCERGMMQARITVGPTDTVTIRGAHLEGNTLVVGVSVSGGGGTIVLDGVKVGVSHSNYGIFGVFFAPDQAARLIISDSTFTGAGDPSPTANPPGGGIVVHPEGSGSARVSLERVNVGGNVFGIAFDGSTSTGGINATIADSITSGNTQDGIVVTTSAGHAPIGVMVTNSKSANNGYGIRSIGPNVTVRVKNSEVVGNNVGLAAQSGGTLLSYGNNGVDANGSNGTFTGTIASK